MRSPRPGKFEPFLADTWWFGLTGRLKGEDFAALASLRAEQGFSAIQLVVGIPPEVGPENEHAASTVGPAWTLKGEINTAYLDLARERIASLNALGLSAIVYGAWGHQINWLGTEGMKRWWQAIVEALDHLDVMYCLTGESNIWLGQERLLLPDETSLDLLSRYGLHPRIAKLPLVRKVWPRLVRLLVRLRRKPQGAVRAGQRARRANQWGEVLAVVSSLTGRPLFVHTLPGETSHEAVENSERLSAITVQTGHDPNSKNDLWQLPIALHERQPDVPFVNLEPWYEGITGRFGAEDQLFAYWACMLAGASAYCYGAHGIWNVGDGSFLSHWGQQTFERAKSLDTPRLIGLSHRVFLDAGGPDLPQVSADEDGGTLLCLSRADLQGGSISFYPDAGKANTLAEGRYYLPATGQYVERAPRSGQLVVVSV